MEKTDGNIRVLRPATLAIVGILPRGNEKSPYPRLVEAVHAFSRPRGSGGFFFPSPPPRGMVQGKSAVRGARFGRFAGKTSCQGRALAVTRACDNSSPLVNQLSVNT